MRRAFLFLALTTACPVLAQTAPAISVDTLKDVTRTLASDEFEGRAPTTPGEAKTVAPLVERFKAAGLRPGNKGSWFQDVPMVESMAEKVRPFTFAGGTAPVTMAYRTDMVAGTYRTVPSIDVRDSEVVFVGYGVNAPEKGWNDYAGVDVRGKTVVILVNDPDWRTPGKDGPFEGRAMTWYGRWPYKYEEAARQGAAAAIIVHEDEPAAYGWGVVQSSWTGPQYNLDEPGGHADQSAIIGWMRRARAQELFRAAGKDLGALTEAAGRKGFRAVPLGLKMSGGFTNRIRRQASRNVVATLPGRGAADEHVLYTAHWDHLGRCDAVGGDDICNGALDNATGTAGLVALAEAHAKAGPARRSLTFVAVTAEESGLLGSKYFAENPIIPIGKMVGGVNMDGLQVAGRTRNFVLTGGGKSEVDDMARRLATAEGRSVEPEANPERGFYYRSDHFSLAKLGVPMLYGEGGEDLVAGGKAAGARATADYIANRYHKPDDEYDPNWNWDGAVQDLSLYYRLGRELADGSAWPNWHPGSEFRAARDKSRAGAR